MTTWLDKMEGITFAIVTGDGIEYRPSWMSTEANRTDTYNYSKFEFKGVAGSYVPRGTPQGTTYDLTIIFQGDDQLTQSDAFRKSAANPKPWQIQHPLYGTIRVTPVSLKYDNSGLNLTTITGSVIETIGINGVALTVSAPDVISQAAAVITQSLNTAYAANVPTPPTAVIATQRANVVSLYSRILARMNDVQADVNALNNQYNAALNVLDTRLNTAEQIITQTANLIMLPANFASNLAVRLAMYSDMFFGVLNANVLKIQSLLNTGGQQLCALYENEAGQVINGMCLATTVNITTDFDYAPDVLAVISTLLSTYNAYLTNINALQSPTGGEPNSYIPDADAQNQLMQLVYATCTNLYNIAQSAQTAITLTLKEDTQLIPFVYSIYGPDPTDAFKLAFIANNNLDMSELFLLPSGRQITYYV